MAGERCRLGGRCASVAAWGVVALSLAIGVDVTQAEPVLIRNDDVAGVLATFAKGWPENRTPYRTAEDTTTWKVYALTMKTLVALGDKAVPELIVACDDSNYQVRAMAARVLGYLQAKAAVPKLIELLKDPQAPVALHAADSLGQIGDPRGLAALRAAQTSDKRGDVLLHIAKSLARTGPLEDDVVEQILGIDPSSIDAAKIGALAPDFTLKDPTGRPWKLSDLRGKKSVVLVFIYGDG